MERIWLRGSYESVPRAKFLVCHFALVEYRTIRGSVQETGVSRTKKKETRRKMNVLGSCTKTFNLTHSHDTSLEALHPRARRLAFRYARYTLRASLSALARMHADTARCDLGVAGYYRLVSREKWKGASGTRNNTRSESRTHLASVFNGMWFVYEGFHGGM